MTGLGRMTRRDVDSADIQAIAKTAFGSLTGTSYLLLRVADARAARTWLSGLRPTSLADLAPDGVPAQIAEATQVAFTAAGLRALGVEEAIVQQFGPEFVEGLAGSANRSQRLGDIGANAPANWRWGVGGREPHILLMLFAKPDSVGALERTTREAAERSGLTIVDVLPTSHMGGVEPFGFVDGVSQPTFDWDRARTPGTKADRAYTNLLALGELLLGYRNEYGFLAETPTLAEGEKNAGLLPPAAHPAGRRDLGRNGSYLVHRELSQDVRGFWRWAAGKSARAGVRPESLAESVVGRRLNGAPLADFEVGLSLPGVRPAGSRRQRLPVRRRSRRPLLPGRRPYPASQSAHGRCARWRRRPDRQSAGDARPNDAPVAEADIVDVALAGEHHGVALPALAGRCDRLGALPSHSPARPRVREKD